MPRTSKNIRRMASLMKRQSEVMEVKELREEGYTQQQIAGIVGKSVNWVNKMLNSREECQLMKVHSIMPTAQSLADDSNIEELFGGK